MKIKISEEEEDIDDEGRPLSEQGESSEKTTKRRKEFRKKVCTSRIVEQKLYSYMYCMNQYDLSLEMYKCATDVAVYDNF